MTDFTWLTVRHLCGHLSQFKVASTIGDERRAEISTEDATKACPACRANQQRKQRRLAVERRKELR